MYFPFRVKSYRSFNSLRHREITALDPVTGKRLRHFESVLGSRRVAEQRLHEVLHSVEQNTYMPSKGLADYKH